MKVGLEAPRIRIDWHSGYCYLTLEEAKQLRHDLDAVLLGLEKLVDPMESTDGCRATWGYSPVRRCQLRLYHPGDHEWLEAIAATGDVTRLVRWRRTETGTPQMGPS